MGGNKVLHNTTQTSMMLKGKEQERDVCQAKRKVQVQLHSFT